MQRGRSRSISRPIAPSPPTKNPPSISTRTTLTSSNSAYIASTIPKHSSPVCPTSTTSATPNRSVRKSRSTSAPGWSSFHDWKHHLWYLVRRFFRAQFSLETRDYFRAKQASLAKRSRIVGVAQFAQIPLLNDHQLVARWRQEMPPTYISDSQDLPIDKLPAGLYLVEATDGHYKAYTLLMVSHIVLITRTATGTFSAFVVDRQTGAPVANARVAWGIGQQIAGHGGNRCRRRCRAARRSKHPECRRQSLGHGHFRR